MPDQESAISLRSSFLGGGDGEVVFQDHNLKCSFSLLQCFFNRQSYFKFTTSRKCMWKYEYWSFKFRITRFSLNFFSNNNLYLLFSTPTKLILMGTGNNRIKNLHNYLFLFYPPTHTKDSLRIIILIHTTMMKVITEDTCVCQASWNNLVNF